MKKITKVILILGISVAIIAIAFFMYFFVGNAKAQINSEWGVDFSQSQAEYLGLNWKENYSAIIDDLGVKNIKLHINWNYVEKKQGQYNFDDADWQIKQASKNNVKLIYVLGMKTGRWPECHVPTWADSLSAKDQKKEVLKYITTVVERYKKEKTIIYWQVENEPLFGFGQCPSWYYKNDDFLKEEVALVKSLDPSRQIIISDTGEQSNWFSAAKIGDIVGITMYRNAWVGVEDTFGVNAYSFLNPVTYMRKAELIQKLFGKPVICIELQAEPWTREDLVNAPLDEQSKSMNLKMFREDVEFAKQTGFNKYYFWGVEWWYWMKTVHNQPEIWNEAKNLF